MLRLLFFVAGIAGIAVFWSAGNWKLAASVCTTFIPFLILVKWHNRLFLRKEWMETVLRVNREESQALG